MIRRDDIDDSLKDLAFDFFYWFSRLEFALKENGLVRAGPRNAAQVDWHRFVEDHERHYEPDDVAKELLANPPDVQVVGNDFTCQWSPLEFSATQSSLSKAALVVRVIRNNLFHGGKHGAEGWDDPRRVEFLLSRGICVLNSFARFAGYEADYERRY